MATVNKLTAREVSSAGIGKHGDGGGLWLVVRQNGSRAWVFRYTRLGKERTMGLGPLDRVSLADARSLARDARRLLAMGQDPINERRARKSNPPAARITKGTSPRPGSFTVAVSLWPKPRRLSSSWPSGNWPVAAGAGRPPTPPGIGNRSRFQAVPSAFIVPPIGCGNRPRVSWFWCPPRGGPRSCAWTSAATDKATPRTGPSHCLTWPAMSKCWSNGSG